MKIILASSSPRRRELLAAIGHEVTAIASGVDELDATSGLLPTDLAQKNAQFKAESIFEKYGLFGADIILGADTVVVHRGQIFGKPANLKEAFAILSTLSGQTHQVITSFYMIGPGGKIRADSVVSDVIFRALSEHEINSYILTQESMDKAGAYGVQGAGAALVKCINGSLTNVIGLPLDEVMKNAEDLRNECC